MMETFEQPFSRHPIRPFLTQATTTRWTVSRGASIRSTHIAGDSEVKLQVSLRETPTLPTERLAQREQCYLRQLNEILTEKFAACYQRKRSASSASLLQTKVRHTEDLYRDRRQRHDSPIPLRRTLRTLLVPDLLLNFL
jgi:hypothetical protein